MAVAQEFLDLLVHPLKKTPLVFHPELNQLRDPEGDDKFSVKEDVPVVLIDSVNEEIARTAQHAEAGTSFSYKEHYQTDAEAYDYTDLPENIIEREEIRRLRENIASRVPENASWVLDVGCGGAWLAEQIVPRGSHVISMDISDINPIKALKKTVAANHHGLVADVFELPIRPESIDCIVASEIIEHVPDPKKFLAALFKVLKPGGRLIVTTPYNELIRTSLCIHCNRLTPHNAHLHSFTEASMKPLLPKEARKVNMEVFNSKLLVKMGLGKLFRFLPLSAWKGIDQFGTQLTGKRAYRLMVLIEK